MLKKTITYTDFNGVNRTEDFYFNLSKAELAEWQLRDEFSGGLETHLSAIIASKSGAKIMDTFREIISKSYGLKSPDGRTFTKSSEISQGFLGSEAYSVLFMELISDPDKASEFINGIVPSEFSQGQEGVRQRMERPQPQDHQSPQPRTVELPPTQPQFEPQASVVPMPPSSPQYQPTHPQFPHSPVMEQQAQPVQPTQPQFIQPVDVPRPPHESGPQG